MSGIKVTRTVHFATERPGQLTIVSGIHYVSNERNVLLETVSTGERGPGGGVGVVRRSEDNGRTWHVVEDLNIERVIEGDLTSERAMPIVIYCDPDSGRLVRLLHTYQDKPGVYPWIYAENPMWRTMRPHLQFSDDEGATWSDAQPVIVAGKPFDETHWMPGVWQGKNGGMLCAAGFALTGRNGAIIASCDSNRLFANGDIVDPDADPEQSSPDGAVLWEASCLHGRWRDDGSLAWTAGEKVVLPRAYSCDGSEEPSLAYLPDGRLFMGIRARTFPNTGQALPSLHYYAISHDHGLTWESPRPLLYDDGAYAYSPACFINVLRSKKNGRFYVITNSADGPCVNCDPRNKLLIGEVDTDTFRIRRDTLTIIDQCDESAKVRFSNWRYYEDRQTGDLALFMTPGCSEHDALAADVVPQSYRYDIELPA